MSRPRFSKESPLFKKLSYALATFGITLTSLTGSGAREAAANTETANQTTRPGQLSHLQTFGEDFSVNGEYQPQTEDPIEIASLGELVLTPSDVIVATDVAKQILPDTNLEEELSRVGVVELPLDLNDPSLSMFSKTVQDRIAEYKQALSDLVLISLPEFKGELEELFSFNLGLYKQGEDYELVIWVQTYSEFSDLNSGSGLLLRPVQERTTEGTWQYLEPNEIGEHVSLLVADELTSQQARSLTILTPDGRMGHLQLETGQPFFGIWQVNPTDPTRAIVKVILLDNTAVSLADAQATPPVEQLGQPNQPASLTAPTPTPKNQLRLVGEEQNIENPTPLIMGSLTEAEITELNQVLKMYPGGNEAQFADFIQENGWQATWDKDRLAFEVRTQTQTYYFFPKIGIEGAKGSEKRAHEDLDDGLMVYGGSIESNFVSGSSGLKISVYTSRNFQVQGKQKIMTFREDLASNKVNIDLMARLLIQEFPQLLGRHMIIHLAADNFDIYGNNPDVIKEALDLVGGYSFSAVGDDGKAGTDLIGNTSFDRVSINANKEYYEHPDALGVSVFTIALTPFATNGTLNVADLNEIGRRIKKVSITYYETTGLPSYVLVATDIDDFQVPSQLVS